MFVAAGAHSHELLKTFTIAAALGVTLFTVANYLRTSAIVVLLIGGIIAGPEVLGLVNPDALGAGLGTIISLAVAIILFEGGLTLDIKGYRSESREIWRILSLGVLVTWLGSAGLIRICFGFDWDFCLLSASLIIVTGPTVIGPLLHRIRVIKRLHHILHWEGVLIDAIGVFIALLCFEYYISTDGAHELVLKDFLMRFAVGGFIGLGFGLALDFVLRREWISKGHVNIFVLAIAMLDFAMADLVIAESGLLSVTVAGLVLGYRKTPQLRDIVSYKVELKDFLIGLLFVLLAANLELRSFLAYGWKLMLVVIGIMIVIRPLNIFVSMRGSTLNLREKLFLGWIAPRGIVAASMASIFALKLSETGAENAQFLETFTYSVIAGTVIVQGFTAGAVGRALKVVRPVPTGWLIVGAHKVARKIAQFLGDQGLDVVLIDTNAREVREAERIGLTALSEDAMQLNPDAYAVLYGCGNFLAITPNSDLNRMLCNRWSELLEGANVYRWEKTGYEIADQQHLMAGHAIWNHIPLNRWMHSDSDEAPLRVRQRGSQPVPAAAHVLLSARPELVTTGTPKTIAPEDEAWLVYDPEAGNRTMTLPLKPENVFLSNADTLQGLYLEMLKHLQRQIPAIAPEDLLQEVIRREQEYSSLLGHGIALPHTWSDAVDQACLLVARPDKPLFCPLTDREIRIVFMLLSPKGHPREHLKHVSHIARLIGTESRRQALQEAVDARALYQVIADS